jgi:NADH:ubiquinone oxidoreductase subunit F (NADH-binding)
MHALEAHRLLPDIPFASYGEYLRAQGGEGITDVALATTPEAILAELAASRLRGRGGAGFPTSTKWQTLRDHPCPTRYVVCNAAEGEPGTFKDRFLLRKNPYALLEGMRIAAITLGALEGYIAIKASFTREIERLQAALAEVVASGAMGSFTLKIVTGPDEYLFGEEKALLNVIEGEGPLPREAHYPPYELGLFATQGSPNPALVNNVETFSHVPSILRHGGASFASLGDPDTPGTLLFTLSGDLQRPGVYELPSGLTLHQLFHEVGGGPRPGRTLQAAISGVSSGILTSADFQAKATFGALQAVGGGLGSAGFVVFDDTRSIPRVAQGVARFLHVESCNQCPSCKINLGLASSALDELFEAHHPHGAPERALLAARHAPQGNRCYLPVQGSVVISSIAHRFQSAMESQDQAPAPSPRIDVAKMVDFDEATRTFSYDEKQIRKRPNWTYVDEDAAEPV